jgi:hypothetical protein
MLFLEAREKPADGLARRADHLPDLFVSQSHFHLAGEFGFGVLIEPSDEQSSQLFAGGIGKNQVTDFAASRGVILR